MIFVCKEYEGKITMVTVKARVFIGKLLFSRRVELFKGNKNLMRRKSIEGRIFSGEGDRKFRLMSGTP